MHGLTGGLGAVTGVVGGMATGATLAATAPAALVGVPLGIAAYSVGAYGPEIIDYGFAAWDAKIAEERADFTNKALMKAKEKKASKLMDEAYRPLEGDSY
jgi:hypothetical protein